MPGFFLSYPSVFKDLAAANIVVNNLIISRSFVKSLVRNAKLCSFQRPRISLEKLNFFIILVLLYCAFKCQEAGFVLARVSAKSLR